MKEKESERKREREWEKERDTVDSGCQVLLISAHFS